MILNLAGPCVRNVVRGGCVDRDIDGGWVGRLTTSGIPIYRGVYIDIARTRNRRRGLVPNVGVNVGPVRGHVGVPLLASAAKAQW